MPQMESKICDPEAVDGRIEVGIAELGRLTAPDGKTFSMVHYTLSMTALAHVKHTLSILSA
jgi:hypothetical protein